MQKIRTDSDFVFPGSRACRACLDSWVLNQCATSAALAPVEGMDKFHKLKGNMQEFSKTAVREILVLCEAPTVSWLSLL